MELLTFYRIEPYVVPKTNLTGSDTERVDMRAFSKRFIGSSLLRFPCTPASE
jgi:hypothetical protein